MEENLDLIAHVERTKVEGCAFLMAASRKRVTGAFCGNPPFEERLPQPWRPIPLPFWAARTWCGSTM